MKSPASMTAICLLSLTSLPLIDCMKVLHHLQMNDHVNQIPNSIHNQVFQEPYPFKGEHTVDSLEPFHNNHILATTSNHQVQHHQNPSLDNTIYQGIEYNIEPSSSPIELEETHNHQTSDDESHFNIDNLDLDSTNHHEFYNNGNHGLNLPTSTGYHPDSHEQAGLYHPWSGIIPRFDHQEHIDNHVHLDPHGIHMSSAYHDSRYPVMNNPEHSNFQPIIDLEHESNHVPDQEKFLHKHSNSWALGNQYDDLQHDLVLTDTQILQPPIAHPYSSPPLENPYQGFIDPKHPNTNFNFEDVLEYITFEDIIPSNDESNHIYELQKDLHQSYSNGVQGYQYVNSHHHLGRQDSAESATHPGGPSSESKPQENYNILNSFDHNRPSSSVATFSESFQRYMQKNKSSNVKSLIDSDNLSTLFPKNCHNSLQRFLEMRKSRKMKSKLRFKKFQ